jgi:RHS repeat-associated protein
LNTVGLYYGGGAAATLYVTRICHNEKGQRLCIQYGNNTVTRYSYDPDTFRLTGMLTTANSGTTTLQNLNYYYDPAGNITYVLDKAQPPIFNANQQVLSDGNYTYDAIYRLISATGREQIWQNSVDEGPANNNYRNYPFDTAAIPAPTNQGAMRSYIQYYTYDAVGNMLQLQHAAGLGSYTRNFIYNTGINNQLLSTTIGGHPAVSYTYDGHGNLLNLPQLPVMSWNYKDEFVAATQQAVSAGTGQTTWYCYDAGGIRSRKVTMSAAVAAGSAKMVSERLYIGQFEIYRSFDGSGNVSLQRETLHVMDDQNRIATIDNKTIDTTGGDGTVRNTYYPRYQYGTHLGSSAYELDDSAGIISYEEYHPFGTTSFQTMDPNNDVPLKRYRYTGKERDEESGLYYHEARYYAPWLCRWTSADPIGIEGGSNFYLYCDNDPIKKIDPTGTTDNTPPDVAQNERTVENLYNSIQALNTEFNTNLNELRTLTANNDQTNRSHEIITRELEIIDKLTETKIQFVAAEETLIESVNQNHTAQVSVHQANEIFFQFLYYKDYVKNYSQDLTNFHLGCVGVTMVITQKSFQELQSAATSPQPSTDTTNMNVYTIHLEDKQLWHQNYDKSITGDPNIQRVEDKYSHDTTPDYVVNATGQINIMGWEPNSSNSMGVNFDFGYYYKANAIFHANHADRAGNPMLVYISNKNFFERTISTNDTDNRRMGCHVAPYCVGYNDFNRSVSGSFQK